MAILSTNYDRSARLLRNRGKTLSETLRPQTSPPLGSVRQEGKPFVPTLVLALRNHDETVRRAAAESLGDLGAEARTAIAALRQARQDREKSVRQQADLALQKICLEVRRAILCAA